MAEKTTPAETVEIVVTPGPRKDTLNLQARRDGKAFAAMTVHRAHAGNQQKFAKQAAVPFETVQQAVATSTPPAAEPAAASIREFTVGLRGMHEPKAKGVAFTDDDPITAFRQALACDNYPAAEPVLEWADRSRLVCVDVDYHDLPLERRPAVAELTALVGAVRPQPVAAWISHGKGLHLIYSTCGDFRADELAACAALSVRSLAPTATVDIATHSRHPGYARPGYPAAGAVLSCTANADLGALLGWLGRDLDEATINEWLAEQGYTRQAKYGHDRCPADAATTSHGEPVFVGDAGITCMKCAAAGITLGSRKAGFFPYTALIAGGFSTRLAGAARHHCHWEHARHILAEDVGITGPWAEQCYAALLTLVHGKDDPRNVEALRRGAGLVRMHGYWATADLARSHARDGLSDRLAKLPAVQRRVSGDNLVVDEERLGIFRGVDDLTPYGYPRVLPVRGMRIGTHFGTGLDPRVVRAVILPDVLAAESAKPARPHYVGARSRMSAAEAGRILAASFPGVNLAFVKLLIAARGCAEIGSGQPPMIAVDGPSGSGKSTTVTVAATLIGDQHVNVAWTQNIEHFLQGLYEASNSAGLVTCDEIIKLAKARGGDPLVGLNPLLTFTPGSLVRKLYTGPVPVTQVPALVIADIDFPRELICDEQLGRRFAHVHLERKVDWQHGVKDIRRWRVLDTRHASAADAIVSAVIDEYFAGGASPVFEDIAKELGFTPLNRSEDFSHDAHDELRTLFTLVCDPQAVKAPEQTWKGPGWKYIKRDGVDPLSKFWPRLCDNPNEGFVSSRRVKETDWAAVLNVRETVEVDLSPNGQSALGIRFRCGKPRAAGLRVNEQINITPTKPNPPPTDDDPPPSHGPEDPAPPPGTAPGVQCASRGVSARDRQEPAAVGAGEDRVTAMPVFIDVETRSACDLKKVSGRQYASHSSTELLSVVALVDQTLVVWTPTLVEPLPSDALALRDSPIGPCVIETFAGPAVPPPIVTAIAGGRALCAHNALGFDRHVWRAMRLPEPTAWYDTLPHCRAAGLPGQLDALGERLFGTGKDKQGAALLQRLCRPDRTGNFLPCSRENALVLARYNIVDVVLLRRLYEAVRDHAETDVLALDDQINTRGIAFDAVVAKALIALEADTADRAGKAAELATAGVVKASDLRRDRHLQKWLQSQGVTLPDLRRDTVTRLLTGKEKLPPAVRQVLEARAAVNRITTGKLQAALACQDADGRVRDSLVYHQAATGRWAGRRLQPHNLPRPAKGLKDVYALLDAVHDAEQFRAALPAGVTTADGISALLRLTLKAGDGRRLCQADFASIEARGVAWCAGDTDLLARYERGDDIYCALATEIFGRPISKRDDKERQIGKQGILGCGYGMGKDTFARSCAESGIDLAAAGTSAEQVVEGYRAAYPKIAGRLVSGVSHTWRDGGLWKDVERAAMAAVQSGRVGAAGRCQFRYEGGVLLIELPSGRCLRYRNARMEEVVPGYARSQGQDAKTKPTVVFDHPRDGRKQLYGGLLTENIVQAICRDLLACAMLECERQGLPVVLHVHDEIVVEVPHEQADDAMRKLAVIMSTTPVWAVGFPIDVEGFVSERYAKSPSQGQTVVAARGGSIL